MESENETENENETVNETVKVRNKVPKKVPKKETCQICCSTAFFKVEGNKEYVECVYCHEVACVKCVVRGYDLDNTSAWGRCIFCRVNWTREIAHTALPKKHHKMLAIRRGHNLMSLERSLLPQTQQVVQMRMLTKRANAELKMLAEKADIIRAIKVRIHAKDFTVLSESLDEALAAVPGVPERLEEHESKRKEKSKKKRSRETTASPEPPSGTTAADADGDTPEQSEAFQEKSDAKPIVAPSIMGACPREGCRGFLQAITQSDAKHVCGMCSYSACGKCHKALAPEHECLSEDLASVATILAETKPCPNCKARIYKVSGCDQMWCTQCQKVFSWTTGQLTKDNEPVHNPHYFTWLNQRRREAAPAAAAAAAAGLDDGARRAARLCMFLPANEIPSYRLVLDEQRVFDGAAEVIRLALHIQNVTIGTLRMDPEKEMKSHEELRVNFLEETISESDFAASLLRRDKRVQKDEERIEVLRAFVAGVSDLVRSAILATNDAWPRVRKETEESLEALRTHINNALQNINKLYGSTRDLTISPRWSIKDGKFYL
jgi:hypothetical protein